MFDIFHPLVLGPITPLAPLKTVRSVGGFEVVRPMIALFLSMASYFVKLVL